MKKIILYLTLLLVSTACNNKKEEPAPTNSIPEPINIQNIPGQWNVIKTVRKTFDSQNQQIGLEEKKYIPGNFALVFGYQDAYMEVSNSTVQLDGYYDIKIPPKRPSFEIRVVTIAPGAWTHAGMYYVDTLVFRKRLVITDTLKSQGLTHINTTTAIQ